MHRGYLHILVGFIMAFSLSFNLGIRQVLHGLHQHEDTVHICDTHRPDGAASAYFESQHHHCAYLTDLLPQFMHSALNFVFEPYQVLVFPEFQPGSYHIHPQDAFFSFLLRGPPVQCS